MRVDGWKWSGHSHVHVGIMDLYPSMGDKKILEAFNQVRSCIINPKGQFKQFEVD